MWFDLTAEARAVAGPKTPESKVATMSSLTTPPRRSTSNFTYIQLGGSERHGKGDAIASSASTGSPRGLSVGPWKSGIRMIYASAVCFYAPRRPRSTELITAVIRSLSPSIASSQIPPPSLPSCPPALRLGVLELIDYIRLLLIN